MNELKITVTNERNEVVESFSYLIKDINILEEIMYFIKKAIVKRVFFK